MRKLNISLLLLLLLSAISCGYNPLQSQDEAVKAAWGEVLNQYQRRADLVPGLVNTVKGYAAHEEKVLTEVTEARSRVGGITATPELLNNPEQFQQFMNAQKEMGASLGRLIAVSENYPTLKADGAFRDFQAQLEGTENRIAVARNRFIGMVQQYNVTVRSFPSNLTAKWLGLSPKPSFTVENEAAVAKPPVVDFAK